MIKCPENELIVIEKGDLLSKCMEMKVNGLRFSQACAAFYEGNYELSYSFADDETYEYKTLRLVDHPHGGLLRERNGGNVRCQNTDDQPGL